MKRFLSLLVLVGLVGCAQGPLPGLHAAVVSGDAEQVRAQLQQGEDPNGRDSVGQPALVYALDQGDFAIAQLLIDGGADVNAEIEPGITIVDALDRAQKRDAGDWLVARGAHRKP